MGPTAQLVPHQNRDIFLVYHYRVEFPPEFDFFPGYSLDGLTFRDWSFSWIHGKEKVGEIVALGLR